MQISFRCWKFTKKAILFQWKTKRNHWDVGDWYIPLNRNSNRIQANVIANQCALSATFIYRLNFNRKTEIVFISREKGYYFQTLCIVIFTICMTGVGLSTEYKNIKLILYLKYFDFTFFKRHIERYNIHHMWPYLYSAVHKAPF